ncbi:hypothetical protein QBC43DRAFT_322473 [Cladorrhinum sp. PSN259]|nr:hypothetical protein QBC43DRAFT_322473 [Cladorrhinum sp. PSN259]
MSTRQPSRVVFVGNIPYGLTEEQISDLFAGAGRVLNFRLVYDRETGRPKGFGFAEFPDYDSAASAVRNLNDHEIMGRKLRVDFSNETVNDDDKDGAAPSAPSYSAPFNGNAPIPAPPAMASSSLPALPPGKELKPGQSAIDAINETLETLTPTQLLDVLQSMKTLATNDPARATELLDKAPQLSYALFQALLIMGLVPPDAINSVIDPGAGAVHQPVAPAPPPVTGYGGYPGATSTPPVAVGGYAPPPVAPVPAPGPAPVAGGQNPEDLVQQLLSLPQEVIDQLPENERAQVLALRAQFAGMQQRR